MESMNHLARLRESFKGLEAACEPIEDGNFFVRRGEGWAVADDVLHLALCMVPIHRSLRVPALLVRKWGEAGGSRSEEEFLNYYRKATATHPWKTIAPFIPRRAAAPDTVTPHAAEDPDVADAFFAFLGRRDEGVPPEAVIGPDTTKQSVMAFFAAQAGHAIAALEKLEMADLDRYRLPIPYAGLITLRELVYFTMMHTEHHRERILTKTGQLTTTGRK